MMQHPENIIVKDSEMSYESGDDTPSSQSISSETSDDFEIISSKKSRKSSLKNQDKKNKNDTISICIPSINEYYNKETIMGIFRKLQIGKVERVDIVNNYQKKTFKYFIHYEKMYNNEKMHKIKEILTSKKPIYIVPFKSKPHIIWKCMMNISKIIKK